MTPAFLGLGATEVLLVLLLALLLFGVDKLPEAARSLGRARAEFGRWQTRMADELALADARIPPTQVEFERGREAQMRAQAAPSFKEVRLQRAAEALDVDTKGRSSAELREAIHAKLDAEAAVEAAPKSSRTGWARGVGMPEAGGAATGEGVEEEAPWPEGDDAEGPAEGEGNDAGIEDARPRRKPSRTPDD